mgnify:CR=1 FL=1
MIDDLDNLSYSQEALATRFILFQGLNSINLFVEDVGSEYLYWIYISYQFH